MLKKVTAMAIIATMTLLCASLVQAERAADPLLAAVSSTVDMSGQAEPLSTAELSAVRGEGTFEQFFAFPQLNRSFTKTFSHEGTTVILVGEAGVGVTITVDSPLIP